MCWNGSWRPAAPRRSSWPLALVRLTEVATPAEKPQLALLGFAEAEELQARLAADDADDDDAPMLRPGQCGHNDTECGTKPFIRTPCRFLHTLIY
jgi:hypothetical protein